MSSTRLFESMNLILDPYDPEKDAKIEAGFTPDLDYALALDPDEAPHPLTFFEMKKKREGQPKKSADKNSSYYFAVRLKEDWGLIGVLAYPWISWNNGNATLKVLTGEPVLREKYMPELLDLGLRYAFTQLNLNRVSLAVFGYNPRGVASYLKTGFREEGCLPGILWRAGNRYDVIYRGVLRSEWEQIPANADQRS